MLLLSSASMPHYGIERFFRFALQAGFEGVEINIDERFDTHDAAYLKELEGDFRLPVRSFSLTATNTEKYLKAYQKCVREFPGVRLALHSPELFGFEYQKWLQKIAPKLASKYGLTLCRVNAPLRFYFGLIPQYSQNSLPQLMKAPAVGLDIAALSSTSVEPSEAIRKVGERLAQVYLTNIRQEVPNSPPQDGRIAIDEVLKQLKKQQYAGDLVVYIAPEQLGEGDDERMLKTLKEAASYCKKHWK
ncbi:sugar phosphate isomerase/epimerase [Candidatus Peribacteria bacterium]|nr:sugar phosphate isomerase/epimerase [Candidatus Peribacteria bacterium]